jgi:Ribosome recycling factor
MTNIINKLKIKRILSSFLAFAIVLTMVPILSITALAASGDITITQQPAPAAQTIFYGQTVSYSCDATRQSGGTLYAGPFYQWKLDGSNVGSESTSSKSYTTAATLAVGDHSIYCYVRSRGTGGIGGTVGTPQNTSTVTLKVLPNNISQYTIDVVGAGVYDGSTAHTPTSVQVSYNGNILVENTHYTVATTNNINVGTAVVTVSGMGLLTGTGTGGFAITPGPGTFPTIEFDVPYVTGLTVAGAIGTYPGLVADTPSQLIYVGDDQPFTGTYTDPSGNFLPVNDTFFISVTKGTPSYGVTIADWNYGGTAKTPIVIGNTGGGTETFLYTGGPDGTYSDTVPPTVPGDYTVTATIAETASFLSGTASATFTINKANQTALVIEGLDATYEGGDFPIEVTLSTSGGSGDGLVSYFVSGPATLSGDVLTITGPGTVGVAAFKAEDDFYNQKTANAVAAVTDIDAPTGAIAIGTNSWNSFLNTITFGVFFKDTKQVDITATDNAPGAISISYFISDAEVDAADLPTLSWVTSDSFTITPNDKYVIYAKLEDASGNIAYINSEGIVLYTDSASSDVELGHIKTTGDKNIAITFNDNTINKITNGAYTLVEGTDYTVTATGITLSGTYLDSLAAGDTEYELAISFNPLGEEYPADPTPGSEEPVEVVVWLTVSKAEVIIITDPTASNVWKGDELSTSVLSDGVASVPGRFEWIDGSVAVDEDGLFGWVFIPDDEDTYERVTGRTDVVAIDKTKLLELIEEAEKLLEGAVAGDKDGEYKQDIYDALEDALEDAKRLVDTPPTTQDDVDAMTDDLQKAIDEFIPNDIPPSSEPDDSSVGDDNSDGGTDVSDGDSVEGRGTDSGIPGTGAASIAGAMAVLALSGAAIVVLKKKRG